MNRYRVLIIDGQEEAREYLEDIFRVWEFDVESASSAERIEEKLERSVCDLLVINFETPGAVWTDLPQRIAIASPQTKTIILASAKTRRRELKALDLQVCAVLNAPPQIGALFAAVSDALHDNRLTLDHEEILRQLSSNRQAVSSQLDRLNEQITSLNEGLATVIENLGGDHIKKGQKTDENVRDLIFSITRDIRDKGDTQPYEAQLALLESCAEDLCSDDVANGKLEASSALSQSELRVASMIRRGLRSEEIAALLHISPDTVKTHRRNIRKKLRIVGKKSDLGAYLQSRSGPRSRSSRDRSGGGAVAKTN